MMAYPARSLTIEVIRQAVLDVKKLLAKGLIVDGRCVEDWPKTKRGANRVILRYYHCPSMVDDLLAWLWDLLPDLNELLGPWAADDIVAAFES